MILDTAIGAALQDEAEADEFLALIGEARTRARNWISF